MKSSLRKFSTNTNSTTDFYILCKREVSRLFVQNFVSHSTTKFRWGTLWCIRKFRALQNNMHKKGISLNSDKIRRSTLLCFERILVSKSFKQRRGEALRFCRIFFYLTGPQKLRQGTILCFRKFLVGKNFLWIRGGISRFCVEVFVTQYRNNSLENTLVFQKNSFIENFHAQEGGITAFRNFLSHRTETKSFVKEPFCFPENFWYRKKFMDKSGLITIFSRNFYVSQCRKLS